MNRLTQFGMVSLSLGLVAGVARATPADLCRVVVTSGHFDAASHELTYWDDGTTLIAIDGHEVSGSDGHVPRLEVRSVELLLGPARFVVPVEATRDLFEPLFWPGRDCRTGCSFVCDPNAPVVAFSGGDGAGAYSVVFVFSVRARWVDRILAEHPDPESPTLVNFPLSTGSP